MARVTGWQGTQALSPSQGCKQPSQGWPPAAHVLQQLGPGLQLLDELVPLVNGSLQAVDSGLGGQQLLLESRNLTGRKTKLGSNGTRGPEGFLSLIVTSEASAPHRCQDKGDASHHCLKASPYYHGCVLPKFLC